MSNIIAELSSEEYLEHTENYDGICTGCAEWTFGGVEPDAEDCPCENCERPMVIGAEQALLCGLIDICSD